MYKQRLNPKVSMHFKTKINKEVGFMCIFKIPKIQGMCGNHNGIQRYCRLEEINYRKFLNNAAIMIQKY